MMFALGIRYLNGWAMATHPADRNRAEWPPHPDRVFMALAAAHFETDGDKNERNALEWLQSLPAPALAADDAIHRSVVTSYVPVNDTEISRGKRDSSDALAKRLDRINAVATLKSAKEAGLGLLPEHRSRQARLFPVAVPHGDENDTETQASMPRVYLIWNEDVPAKSRQILVDLCAKVTSIGHSASLVQMWVEPSPPEANLIPLNGIASKHRLRVTGNGRLDQLQTRYAAGLRPTSLLWQGYSNPPMDEASIARSQSCFDSALLILRRVTGPRLGLESTLQLTEALRNTVMTRCGVQPPSEWISGHTADGSPSQKPHLAFIPLPHVGREHAEGHLLGVALAVPRNIPTEEQRHLGGVLFDDQGLPRDLEIRMGRIGVWKMQLDEGEDTRSALQTETWTTGRDGAKRWATVTPIVFDRHPKKPGDAEETLAAACQRVGLPRPKDVILTSVSMFIGVPHARRFPLMQRKTGGNLHHTHAILTFAQPIVGPVLLGAGRFRGYGLCRPLREGGAA
jgi:CRISPR-associated protein Csb2